MPEEPLDSAAPDADDVETADSVHKNRTDGAGPSAHFPNALSDGASPVDATNADDAGSLTPAEIATLETVAAGDASSAVESSSIGTDPPDRSKSGASGAVSDAAMSSAAGAGSVPSVGAEDAMTVSIAEGRVDQDTRSVETPTAGAQTFEFPDFGGGDAGAAVQDISILRDVDLKVHIELGRTTMFIEDVLKLSEGSVVELDNLAGDPVDVYVNERLVARGEVLVLNDNFCVRVNEIVTGPQRVSVA